MKVSTPCFLFACVILEPYSPYRHQKALQRYIAIWEFRAQRSDELSLTKVSNELLCYI